eukprot:4108541-Amphidinium_carterae.1
MAPWEGQPISKVLAGLSILHEMNALPGKWPTSKRATSRQRSSSRNQDKPKKHMAGWAWRCTSCECYNFGYRTSCFRCNEQMLQKQIKAVKDDPILKE